MNNWLSLLGFTCFFFSKIYAASNANVISDDFTLKLIAPLLPYELRSTSINTIAQDRSGLLWIGTPSGLIKYDGHNTALYGEGLSGGQKIINRDIRAIAEGPSGTLLIGSFGGGVYRFKKNTSSSNSHFEHVEAIQGQYVKDITRSKSGDFWISIDSSVVLYSEASKQTMKWNLRSSTLSPVGALPILELPSGQLLVGASGKLLSINRKNLNIVKMKFEHDALTDFFEISALELLPNGYVLVATSKGMVVVYDTERLEVVSATNVSQSYVNIFDLLIVDDVLFVASDSGLFISKINDLSFQFYLDTSRAFSSSDIYVLFSIDSYVFAGTLAGLEVLSFTPLTLHNSRSSGVGNDVQAFEEAPNGTLWVGTYEGLFLRESTNISHQKVYPKDRDEFSLDDRRISSLAFLNDTLWLGLFDGGLYTIDIMDPDLKYTKFPGSSDWTVLTLYADKIDSDLWIGTLNHGLFKVNNNEISSFYEKALLTEKTVSSIFRDSTGHIYATSIDKIYRYAKEDQKFEHLKLLHQTPGTEPIIILTLFQSHDGDIWIGTANNGIFRWRLQSQIENKFIAEKINKTSELSTRTIYGIQQDLHGDIWLSTNKGIIQTDANGSTLRQFTVSDGLQHADFSSGASFKSSDGKIFFGGPGGYNVIDPDRVGDAPPPPTTTVTSIQFASNAAYPAMRVEDETRVRLSHNDKFITFSFSVMDFFASRSSQYKYRLDNFDNEWTDGGFQNSATYTNLPAGEYTFRVKGRNSAGVWDPNEARVLVSVFPPPWKTPTAYSLYTIISVLLGWMAYRVYHSYIIEREAREIAREMYEAEMRAEEDMQEQIEHHDDMLQVADQYHRNTLKLIEAIISTGGDGHQTNTTSLLQDITQASGLEIVSLVESSMGFSAEGPAINLHDFVENIVVRLLEQSDIDSDTIVLVNELGKDLSPADVGFPFAIILFELLKNCLQHAFSADLPANYIVVRMEEIIDPLNDIHEYRLTVHDSGRGMTESPTSSSESGSGLSIIQSIVNKWSGSMTINNDEGTCVEVILAPSPYLD